MKKVISTILIILLIFVSCITFTSCDIVEKIKSFGKTAGENYETYNAYDYAIIACPDGSVLQFNLAYWCITDDYIVLKSDEGIYYQTSPENCTLVNDPEIDINISKMKLDLNFSYYKKAIIKLSDGNCLTLDIDLHFSPTKNYYCIHTTDGMTYRAHIRDIILIK